MRRKKEDINMSIKYSDFQAPNGKFFEQNDIDYLMNNGYTLKDALEELSKIDKYRKKKKSKDGEKKVKKSKPAGGKVKKSKPSGGKVRPAKAKKPGRAAKLGALAAKGGAAGMAAQAAFAQYQETGEITAIDEVLMEYE